MSNKRDLHRLVREVLSIAATSAFLDVTAEDVARVFLCGVLMPLRARSVPEYRVREIVENALTRLNEQPESMMDYVAELLGREQAETLFGVSPRGQG